jgi:C-terminal processing protease CtpA/Prc
VHSLTVYDRVRNSTLERYTMATAPGPRRPDVPLYALVDDVTRSAAEDVPFVLQSMKRATIVRTRTAGAGRNDTILTASCRCRRTRASVPARRR